MGDVTFEQILDAMQRNADTAARLLVAADLLKQAQDNGSHGNNSIQVVVPSPEAGERAAMRTEKYTYLLAGLLIGTMAWFGANQLDNGRKIERNQDYLNMLWQRYPELRPEKIQPEKNQ